MLEPGPGCRRRRSVDGVQSAPWPTNTTGGVCAALPTETAIAIAAQNKPAPMRIKNLPAGAPAPLALVLPHPRFHCQRL
jgi:hypothetical protein